jgi:hypothetical protein
MDTPFKYFETLEMRPTVIVVSIGKWLGDVARLHNFSAMVDYS